MVRPLIAGDTIEAQLLLRERPLQNVFLDHVVSAGVLGRVPGFFGHFSGERLDALLMIGPMGGTTLAARGSEGCEELGRATGQLPVRPRHIVGAEDVTEPFWRAYQPFAPELVWTRREPFYVLEHDQLQAADHEDRVHIEPARERDIDEIVANSAAQHIEDLGDDRRSIDPHGFLERHRKDVLEKRWWVTREGKQILFQVHVGAENDVTVQLGGVMTPESLRNRGHATRGMRAICDSLFERGKARAAVSLFCDEGNLAARHVYERVGFQQKLHYRSWLLNEPLERCDAQYL